MKYPFRIRTNKKRLFQTFACFCITLLGSSLFCIFTLYLSINYEKEGAQQLAQIQAGKVKSVLDHQLQTTMTISMLVTENNGNISNLEKWMMEIVEYNDIESVALAPNGVISVAYPYKGNESAIGHDLIHDPARSTEALEALHSGKLTLSGPYILRQGYYGLIGRQAVYLDDENGNKQFWGFSCVTLKLPHAIKDAQLENLSEKNYQYQIWRINPDTHKRQVITGKKTNFNSDCITERIVLPNSVWYLSIYPKNGWIPLWDYMIRFTIVLAFSILITILYWYVRKLDRSRNELRISMEQQTQNYLQMNQLNEDLNSFRHDVKNHMLSIDTLLNNADILGAKKYITGIHQTFLTSSAITNTENYVFDALLAEKKHIAKEKGIAMHSEIFISHQLKIENMDWSILFGNLLDNALEACQKEGLEQPSIQIQVLSRGNLMHAKISNSCLEAPLIENGALHTTKQNPEKHGIGMKQIAAIIKKYDGTMEFFYDQQVFTISFMLCDV